MVTRTVRVKSVKVVDSPPMVCDVTVQDNHNLFICNEISDKPVLVHNCLDENMKVLMLYGTPAYGLAQILAYYGNAFYYDARFSKDDRQDIANRDLSDEVLDYCAMDTQACFRVHELQQERAALQRVGKHNYRRFYRRLLLTQMSDTVHVMSGMEQTGAHLDIEYLLLLRDRRRSPVLAKRKELAAQMRESEHVQTANRLLCEVQGVPPGGGIFGNTQAWVFDPNKAAHKQMLFIQVMGLEPLSTGKDDAASIDAAFQKKYKEHPEVADFTTLSKLKKLLTSYVNAFYKKIGKSRDGKVDHRLRPQYGFKDVVTGRSNSSEPSLQQTPQHGPDAKFIKRSFTARVGCLVIKLDYAAHEVRCWGIISKDAVLAMMFKVVHNLRLRFRQQPTARHRDDLKEKGDPHKLNYQFFTGTPVEKVTKEQRQDSKVITFGTMYGKSDRSLARDTGKSEAEMKKVKGGFFAKFFKAGNWIQWTCDFSADRLYTYNPLGFKRNLFAYMTEVPGLVSAMKRRAANSPIQGFASQLGFLAARLYSEKLWESLQDLYGLDPDGEELQSIGVPTNLYPSMMVHDSVEVEVNYRYIPLVLRLLEWCTTVGVEQKVAETFHFQFNVGLAVDFDIGASGDAMQRWDYTKKNLLHNIRSALERQRDEIGYNVNVEETMAMIRAEGKRIQPWLDEHFPLNTEFYEGVEG